MSADEPGQVLRPGLWLGQENRVVSMTLHYIHGWSVHDSTGEDYTEKQFPDGLLVSDEQWVDTSARSRHAWPATRAALPGPDRESQIETMFDALTEYSARRKWYGRDLATALVDAVAAPGGRAEEAEREFVATSRAVALVRFTEELNRLHDLDLYVDEVHYVLTRSRTTLAAASPLPTGTASGEGEPRE